MRLVLTIGGGVITFTSLNDDGPYPFLQSVGSIRIAARAGSSSSFGANETPTASAMLSNQNRRVAALIGNPERARAEIFDDDGISAFVGFVSAIIYGLTIQLKLES